MSAAPTHKDPSKGWLILFFVCFVITIVGIGCFAAMFYNVNAPEAGVEAGHH